MSLSELLKLIFTPIFAYCLLFLIFPVYAGTITSAVSATGVTGLAAGVGHTCAVLNGGVQCWGVNYDSRLGDGTTIDRLTPVQIITANSGVTAIDSSGFHTCAVVSGGVLCWGSNFHG